MASSFVKLNLIKAHNVNKINSIYIKSRNIFNMLIFGVLSVIMMSSFLIGNGFYFTPKSQQNEYRIEMIAKESTIKIIPKTIPRMEQKILCATFLEAVLRFYKDPENKAAFEQWCMGKGDHADGQKDG